MYPYLTPGYIVRSPTMEDIPAILELLRAVDLAEQGEADPLTPDNIVRDWEGLDLGLDAWLMIAPDGSLSGYATLTEDTGGRLFADCYVHPAHTGRGIGTTLVKETERRAEAIVAAGPAGTRRVLVNNIVANTTTARNLLESRGYGLTRVYFRMEIALEGLPPAPVWPEGISVRACDGSEDDLRLAHATIEEGFKDHWAHPPRSYEDWRQRTVREGFDPSLWFFAQEGGQTAGAALCYRRDDGSGWINQLAVLRPWRKRGLGLALLHHAFRAFSERECRTVGLGVDGQSLTGAQRLYERAGMRIASRYARYEKELRPGRDLYDEL
jgi:mycothiol synthase